MSLLAFFASPLTVKSKLIVALSLFVLGLLIGAYSTYTITSWKRDSEQLAIEQAKQEFQEQFTKHESSISKILQDKLIQLRSNEREIIREIPKIITRDVYHNNCIDNDGLRVLESARTSKTNPAKSTN